MTGHDRPAEAGHIHEAMYRPGVPGVIPAPEPPGDDPPPKRRGKEKDSSEGAQVAPSVVEEGV